MLSTSAFSFSCQDLNSYSKSNKIGWTPIRSVIIRVKIDTEKHRKIGQPTRLDYKTKPICHLDDKIYREKTIFKRFWEYRRVFSHKEEPDKARSWPREFCYSRPCYYIPCYRAFWDFLLLHTLLLESLLSETVLLDALLFDTLLLRTLLLEALLLDTLAKRATTE